MFDELEVHGALKQGYAFVCAMCRRLHGAPGTTLAGVGKDCEARTLNLACGGPLAGLAFPEYQGPLTEDWMELHCFRCGTALILGTIEHEGTKRHLGVCERCRPMLGGEAVGDRLEKPVELIVRAGDLVKQNRIKT